jgi:hypothetical protein
MGAARRGDLRHFDHTGVAVAEAMRPVTLNAKYLGVDVKRVVIALASEVLKFRQRGRRATRGKSL